MRTVVCLVVLALAVVSAEEKSLVGPDVELLSKCTNSLTTLISHGNSRSKASHSHPRRSCAHRGLGACQGQTV